MKIKNIPQFRTWFKNLHRSRQNQYFNEHFMGTNHEDFTGFFGMYHGEKQDIYGYLRKEVEMAEDGQAIFEFLQNAADSNSTDFYMFYDDNYFIAINNGEPFTKEGVKSILNIGQSYGKTDCGKIGRFGIGFKLVHRLVGKTSGLDEIINQYKGPQMFSWSQRSHFDDFIKTGNIDLSLVEFEEEHPWLLKILLTNFPAAPGEEVLDTDHKIRTPYPLDEVYKFQSFLNKCLPHINIDAMDQGTIFFLELGENKIELLKNDEQDLEDGIENSLFFLKSISTVNVNGKDLIRNPAMVIEDAMLVMPESDEFKNLQLSEERDLACPAVIQLGYMPYNKGLKHIKNKPNFFKYFPIGDESNGLNFIIHSNIFQIGSNRRTIHNDVINQKLLQLISNKTIDLLEANKTSDRNKFLNIYSNILVSDAPKHQGNSWQKEWLYTPLLTYTQNNTPTSRGNYRSSNEVAIKNTSLAIEPHLLGINKEWFAWGDTEETSYLIKEARNVEKLSLKRWYVSDLIEAGDVEKIDSWIAGLDSEQYKTFLEELNDNIPQKKIEIIRFIKCSNGEYTSINEAASSTSIVCTISKIEDITSILDELGLQTTTLNFSLYDHIRQKASDKISYLRVENESRLFDNYIERVTKENTLTPAKRKELFLKVKELHGVGPQSLSEWALFSDNVGCIKPLNQLIDPRLQIEAWLKQYQLSNTEILFKDLEKYLIDQTTILNHIIVPNWGNIINQIVDENIKVLELYKCVTEKYYFEDLHKSLALGALSYIHTANGFLANSEVFYHQELANVNAYAALQQAIEKATEHITPSKEALPFLEMAPFITYDKKLLGDLHNCKLSQEEARALTYYFSLTSENIFLKGSFSESGAVVDFERGGKAQYYTDDVALIEFINNLPDNDLALLPSCLHEFKAAEGIIRNEELYKGIISDLGDNARDYWPELLPLLKHKDVIRKYLLDFETIEIEERKVYEKTGSEYQLLSYIFAYLNDSQIQELKLKVNITSQSGDKFFVSDVLTSNKVDFEIDKRHYSIELSKVLPSSKSFENATTLQEVAQALKKSGIPKEKLTLLLGTETTDKEELLDSVAHELNDSIEDGLLLNAHQVAFALLYERTNGYPNFSELKIKDVSGEKHALGSGWYVTPFTFIKNVAILNNQYEGLVRLLKLDDDNPVFNLNNGSYIRLHPCFNAEGIFEAPFVSENLDESSSRGLLSLLYTQYSKNLQTKLLFEKANWSLIEEEKVEKVLGFEPSNTCIASGKLVLVDEQAPKWLQEWLNENSSRSSLLKALGFQLPDADIFKLRSAFLVDSETVILKETTENLDIPKRLLENTLEWLAESNFCLERNDQIALLEWLIEEIGLDLEDYWKPDMETLENEAIEWNEAAYLKWRQNTEESFDIFLYKGEMPYLFSYNNSLLAKINSGNYYFDEEYKFLYVNGLVSPTQKVLTELMNDGSNHLSYESYNDLLSHQNLESHEELLRLRQENEELAELRKKVMIYEEQNAGSSENSLKETNNVDKETQKAYNLDARRAVKQALLNHPDYNCSEWNTEVGFSKVYGQVTKNGKTIDLVVKSARNGNIFLDPGEFNLLASDSDNQLFVYNGSNVQNVTFQSIFEANNYVQVQFDTDHMPLELIAKMAEAFQYIKNTKFVVENPNFSAADFFEGFMGINSINEGLISEASEDEY